MNLFVTTLVSTLVLLAHFHSGEATDSTLKISSVVVRQEAAGVCEGGSDLDLILSWFYDTEWPFETKDIIFTDPDTENNNNRARALGNICVSSWCAINVSLCKKMGCPTGRRLGEKNRELEEAPAMELNVWDGCKKKDCAFQDIPGWEDLEITGMKKGKKLTSKKCDLKRVWVDIWAA